MSAGLVVGGALILAGWWLATRHEEVATYAVRGAVNSVFLDLGSADAEIVGGAEQDGVEVRRTDRFAFGHRALSRPDAAGGVLRIRARCPKTVAGSCHAAYRLTVPDNVPINVRTSSGEVRFSGYRGSARIDTTTGDIAVGGYCGFFLRARTDAGDVRAGAACATERLELRSRTGDVRATVPPGRYRVDADSDEGTRRVSGVTAADDAPFQIQALSSGGDVDVEGTG